MAGSQWPLIHEERVALIADLDRVPEAQWSTQSLCAAWTVRDVLAHVTTTAKMTPAKFIGRLAGSGFRFNAFNEKGVREEQGATPADALARFKAQLDRTTSPPGPLDAMVAEIVIHGEDIRRPLGIAHTYQPESTHAGRQLRHQGQPAARRQAPSDRAQAHGHRRRLERRRRSGGERAAGLDHHRPDRAEGRARRSHR